MGIGRGRGMALVGAMALGVAAAVAAPAWAAPPPLAAYGALPDVEIMALAPGGERLAALTRLNGRRVVAVFDRSMTLIKQFDVADVKVRNLTFATDGILLIERSTTEALPPGFTAKSAEFFQTIIAPLDGRPAQVVFSDRSDVIDSTMQYYGTRIIDGRPIGYFTGLRLRRGSLGEGWVFDHGRPVLYAVDLVANTAKLADDASAEGYDRHRLIGADGAVAATMDVAEGTGSWTLRGADNTLLAKGKSYNGRASILGFGPDGQSVIYGVRAGQDEGADWYRVPLAGGPPEPFLPEVDVRRLLVDEASDRIIGYYDDTDRAVALDPALQPRVAAVLKAFAGRNPELLAWTGGLDRALVETSGSGDSGSYYVVDLAAKRADSVGVARAAIPAEAVGAISTVRYTASDGLALDGILTLPPGRTGKGLPLVVLPHGGPAGHDRPAFDWWAQAFAARGYAVFQPNFRGSTGRGLEFQRAGWGEWGGKMQTDISDGVAHLAKEGVVDPKRACIVGASYGGYAALAGVTVQQGLYRCAVSVAGVSDLALLSRLENREANLSRQTQRSLREELGPAARFRAVSPRFQADRADAPVLLIHGRDDTVVPLVHSTVMADALRDAGKPVEFLTLDGEDHWLSRGETRLAMLTAAVAFVEKHNPAN